MLDSFCGGIMAAGAGRHRGSGFASVPLRAPPPDRGNNGAGLDQGQADNPVMTLASSYPSNTRRL
jgi:hypothetical protein